MRRDAAVTGRMVAEQLGGRADTAASVPFLVLDLGRGCDPHQARYGRCRWRSSWRATATQAQAEHHRHQLDAHRRRRTARRGRRRLVISRRAR